MPEDRSLAMKPWAQQPGEPDRWYARFLLYSAFPASSRSILAAQRHEASPTQQRSPAVGGQWKAMASRWRWRERAEAHDKQLAQEVAEATGEQVKRLRARACDVAELAMTKIQEALETCGVGEDIPRALTAVARLLETVAGRVAPEVAISVTSGSVAPLLSPEELLERVREALRLVHQGHCDAA
jgi:hypothetical protein